MREMFSVMLTLHLNDDDLEKWIIRGIPATQGAQCVHYRADEWSDGGSDGGERPHGRMGISLVLIVIVLENIRPLEFHHRAAAPTLFMSSVFKFIWSRLITEVFLSCHECAEYGSAKINK